mmetsp:Transcript_13384/g.35975  ORF Transcript_13384/g.35975 Transcript_13384/m.35975 type:complete len:280 (-) Transcript_13384:904-1743(-)|eukprot:CAMPEP_0185832472 /NCGR_PEP_ID=MMETSP1353-20130828/2099_1 /TAXON_ID=1077150 /ORGANISM="Erythrolobus australicus, Strain CCMP3124" /LENGTH=279 /DNA_ID=CAMNT_0028530647 /DNA_START=430 /DNA_END=1269 /DNA_ORIENTATION=-
MSPLHTAKLSGESGETEPLADGAGSNTHSRCRARHKRQNSWRKHTRVSNGRMELALCWRELRSRDSGLDSLALGSLPAELISYIGLHIPVPRVFVTQLVSNRGTASDFGPAVVLCGSEVWVNGVGVCTPAQAPITTATTTSFAPSLCGESMREGRGLHWQLHDNLEILRSRNRTRAPVAAQLQFTPDGSEFSGLCWLQDPDDHELSVYVWRGRLQPSSQPDGDPFCGASSCYALPSPSTTEQPILATATSSLAGLTLAERCERLRAAWSRAPPGAPQPA